MAKAEKYRYSFKTLEGQTCNVRFEFEGWLGGSTTLVASSQPFVLKEFNSDEDIFKPLRPQIADMNFIASASGVSIDDFLMDNDDDVIVYFDFGVWGNYWIGYMLQDDYQEVWEDTNHIITIRASEGIGLLKNRSLSNNGLELIGRYNCLDLVKYAMQGCVQNFVSFKIYSNLYYVSMTDGSGNTGFDQADLDAKTFQIEVTEYDDSYTTLEKINRAWNQTLFLYKGNWVIIRVEEYFIPLTQSIKGFGETLGVRTAVNQRFDINVGLNEDVKPISPSMLRFIQRRTKTDTIQFDYNAISEIVQNGSFSRGSFISEVDFTKSYNVNTWAYEDAFLDIGAIPTSGTFTRIEEYSSIEGPLFDNYVRFNITSSPVVGISYIRSNDISVLTGEKLDFSVDAKFKLNFTDNGKAPSVYILFYGTGNNYFLKDNGDWVLTNSDFTTNVEWLGIEFNKASSPDDTSWVTFAVNSQPAPEVGYINILLAGHNDQYVTGQERYFKNLRFTMVSVFGGQEFNNISGIKSIYTKPEDLKMVFDETIYMDDSFSDNFKGSLFRADGITLTDKRWYRYRYPNEVFGFRQENDISHWFHNRFNRSKIDANFYGLTWNGGTDPIGLINTVVFVDDDPDKIYMIANMREMDFSSSTWSATLVEVWDDNKDPNQPSLKTFDVDTYNNTYIGITKVPWLVINQAEFVSNLAVNQFTYIGGNTINPSIDCEVNGTINSLTSGTSVTFDLTINGVSKKQQIVNCTTLPTLFTLNLDVITTINNNDILAVTISNNVDEINIGLGFMTFTYSSSGTPNYNNYKFEYIYK